MRDRRRNAASRCRNRFELFRRLTGGEALEERTVLAELQAPLLFDPAHLETGTIIDPPAIRPISPAWFESFSDELSNENQWMVQLAGSLAQQLQNVSETRDLLAPGDLQVVRGLGMQGWVLARSSGDPATVEDWLRSQSFVASFERNQVVGASVTPNDASFVQLWGMHNTGQTGGTPDADIDAPEAWDLATGSSQVVVGIIDTGVDYNHPDLAANMWRNPGEIAANGIDDDHNGFVDDVYGYNFYSRTSNPMDDNRHGTHVAGTIAGIGNNGAGVAGVNWSSSIMALKFLDSSGSGYISDAVSAVNYATMMRTTYGVNLKVTNNSWGGGGYSQALYDAISANGAAGMLFIAAAGNDGINTDSSPSYPASYNLSTIISVAATDYRDTLAYFSNYGVSNVDLAAPGVDIYSSLPGNSYGLLSGTSMATPHVAGVAALAWAYSPTSTAAQIRGAILAGVDRITSLTSSVASGGRLNARGTLIQLRMSVLSSTPAKNVILTSPPTSVTIDFTHPFDPTSVEASDLVMSGAPADSWTAADADSITFNWNVSPVTQSGAQLLSMAANAVRRISDGNGNDAWQSTFFFDPIPMAIASSIPAQGAVVASRPSTIRLDFNEPLNTATVQASDLSLDFGSVTALAIVDADTVEFTVTGLLRDGVVNYAIAEGSIFDLNGSPSPRLTGSFRIDDPLVNRYPSTNVPKAIADLATITSTLTIATPIAIADLDVDLTINHPNAADLDVYLRAPDGTTIALFNDVGGSGDNFTGTILDDEATTPVTSGIAPFIGRYKPAVALSTFKGFNAMGTWTLQITDDSSTSTGTLIDWGLTIASDLTIAPRVSSVQPLPADGGNTWAALSTLTVWFSEVMDAATVNTPSQWSLISAGGDNAFDTGDDAPIGLSIPTPYAGGLSATLAIAGAPLPTGKYRLTAAAGLRDLAGNALDGNGDGTGGDGFARTFNVQPTATAIPTIENFEAGALAALPAWWEFSTGASGRALVANSGQPHSGNFHLLLDETAAYAGPQYATLHLDLAGKSQLTLDFWQKEFGDVYDSTDDRVQISSNGTTWLTVVLLTGTNSEAFYQHHTLNLDAAIAAGGLTYTRDFQIRFSQDNYYLSSGGFAFDDIRVSQLDASGPRVLSQSPISSQQVAAPLSSFTVTFSEAVDPSSFTIADITLTDPTNGVVAISGNPVPSADQKTFTITLTPPQTLVGTYTLKIGTDVLDLVGNAMNQDNDGISGEANDFYSSSLQIGPPVAQAVPYQQGFEAGNIAELGGWKFTVATGVIDILPAGFPHGGQSQLRFTSGSGTTREALLVLDLSSMVGRTDLMLDFWMKQLSTTTSHNLGIHVSGNGTTFTSVATSLSNPTADTFEHYSYDLDAALASAGIAFDSDVYIRFTQTAFTTDRMLTLDDLRIGTTDAIGPRILSNTAPTPAGAFTVTFNEAIDPATFTAGDVFVTGPNGLPMQLAGNPVPSADNKTFTLQFATIIAGTYRVTIGPDVRDLAGNAMNQDNDGLTGESGDFYSNTSLVLGPAVPQAFPYTQGFESGSLAGLAGWSFTSATSTVVDASNANNPLGAYHLKFDNTTSSGSNTATLALDLSGQVGATNLELDFAVQSLVSLSTINAISVAVSTNNSSFTTISAASQLVSLALGQYTQFVLDLDAALASAGITPDADIYIRFSHNGTTGQLATLDNVRVSNTDLFGPAVTSVGFVPGTQSFTVTFNEPINPASFTADDVAVTGPTGYAVPLAGNPVPSADNRTFTLQLGSGVFGQYALRVGPDVRDAAGNWMNQDNDLQSGETNGNDQYNGNFTMGPPAAQAFPYVQDFNGGNLSNLPGWSFSFTSSGTIDLVSSDNPRGAYHLKFDQATSGTKTATLLMDLSSQAGKTDLALDFWLQTISSSSSLTLQISGNGSTFVTVGSSITAPSIGQYTYYAYDLDAALASAGIALDSDVYIRFSHTGSTASQELTLDDVRISNTDVLGPKVTSNSLVNPGASLTVTFDEPIDPATFTAADVTITGPIGLAVGLNGDPVPSADNRTFTLALTSGILGSYTLRVGSNIADFAGNLLNQDGDGLFGEATADAYNGAFTVGPPVAQTVPYTQGFESGNFQSLPGWTFATAANGKQELVSTGSPRGAFHLKFGETASSTQQAVLALDLSALVGATNLTLDFWLKDLSSTTAHTIAIAVSGDGNTWTTVNNASALAPAVGLQYTQYALDLDAALNSASIVFDSSVYIRFLHSVTSGTYEMTFDDVRVSQLDLTGPRVSSYSPITPTAAFTVTFNEAIDPATFTASDVSVTGPLGAAVALSGNPVPSADNRTFTINLASGVGGNYAFQLGLDIRDAAGNLMNQDNDLLTGETNGDDDYENTFQIGPPVAQAFPYAQGFESLGSDGIAGWTFATTGTPATIRVATNNNPHGGAGHLEFGGPSSGSQQATLMLDLSSQLSATDLELDFWLKGVNANPSTNILSVAASGDGINWTTFPQASSLTVPGNGQYVQFVLDLDAALSAASIARDSSVFLRLTHQSGSSYNEMVVDDLRVGKADVFGPRVSQISTIAGLGQFAIIFSEPVDPATITASDLTLTDPAGFPVVLEGSPTATPDNMGFVFSLPNPLNGTYRLTIGSDIRDAAGNLLNQAGDVWNGNTSYSTTFNISAAALQNFPYVQDFEAGQLRLLNGLSLATTGDGEISLTASDGPHDSYHLLFDQRASGSQSVILGMDLSSQIGATNLALDFWLKGLKASSSSFVVQASGNGTTYFTLTNGSLGAPPLNQYTHYAFDLDAALSAAGIALDADVYLKLTHTGTSANQEVLLDDLRLSIADVFGPKISVSQTATANGSFTVTFSEEIDPATFTAADVTLTGPTGFPAALAGNPVMGADGRTYTLALAGGVRGSYALTIGPDIRDLAGNQMNQNGNTLFGEAADVYSSTVTLGPPTPQAFPYVEGFEGGSLSALPGWSFGFTSTGTTELTSANNPHGGNYHLKFDQTSSGNSLADIVVNLSSQVGATNLALDFWLQCVGTNVGGDSLYVRLSGNGVSYQTFSGGIGLSPTVLNQQTHFSLDLDAALKSTNVAIDGDVYIRFERMSFGNFYEMTLDDVRISNFDVVGPKITGINTVSPGVFAVTFDEAIDPATFTAADVVAKGPHGFADTLAGNPVPSADKKTFTITLAGAVAGTHSFVIGPDVRDLAGNRMNQDGDAIDGESGSDSLSGSWIVPVVPQPLPFVQGFESGNIGSMAGLQYSVMGTGNLTVTNSGTPRGSYHLKFDQDSSGDESVVAALDLSNQVGATDLALEFWLQTTTSQTAAVKISGDGSTWVTIAPDGCCLSPPVNQYTRVAYDLDAALNAAGIAFDNNVYVMISHSGSSATAEIAIDDLRIANADLLGPRVVSNQASTTTGAFTVTFDEPIDPATFTAADVIVTGPVGGAVALTGNPVPSADNKTFTLTLASAVFGVHALRITQDIRDFAGNLLNQDADGFAGETSGQDAYNGTVTLGPPAPQAFPYQQKFEAGSLAALAGWTFSAGTNATIDVSTASAPRDAYHLRYVQTAIGAKYAAFVVDLSGQQQNTDLVLDFWMKEISVNATIDVQVSGDGNTYATIAQGAALSPPTIDQYTHFAFDLDAALAAAGVALDGDVYIRFLHAGTTAAQQVVFDDVRVSSEDNLGPRVVSATTTTLANVISVTFSEPIDAATFTAADVAITGPTGLAAALAGAPAPSADNRTFTLTVNSAAMGVYSLSIGPDVRDAAGNWMNQDNDPLVGETNGQDAYAATYTFGPPTAQTVPYLQDFESAALPGWTFGVTATGNVDRTATNSPRGASHLKFDQASSGISTEQADLWLDLSAQAGATNLSLDFYAQWMLFSGLNTLTVLLSGDGVTWTPIPQGNALLAPTINQYYHYSYDLDAAMATLGITADNSVFVRFLHSGNSATHEFTLDDVRISNLDLFGPFIASQSFSAATKTITVTFNEPIDPATFTVPDITATTSAGWVNNVADSVIIDTGDHKTFQFALAKATVGAHTFSIGPDIRDLAGNPMNQDNDPITGETTDFYTGTPVVFGPATPQAFPYLEGFESGDFDLIPGMTFAVSNGGATLMTSSFSPRGTRHAFLGSPGTEQIIVALNLASQAGQTDLELDFWAQSITTPSALSVHVSGDGTTWFLLPQGTVTPSLSYGRFAFDLDAALAAQSIALDGDVYVRFTHTGSLASEVLTLDDIHVGNADVFGPRVTSQTPTGTVPFAPATITINLNEAIDPATLSSADFTLFGPAGMAMALDGEPVLSADQRAISVSFTPNYYGSYTLKVGPDLRDAAGNLMNQDNDPIGGEGQQDQYAGVVTVGPPPKQTIPYVQNFDSADAAALTGWSFAMTGTGAANIVGTGFPYTGAGHLKLSQTSLESTTQTATLVFDLSAHTGATNLVLDYWYKAIGNYSFVTQVSGDGVAWNTFVSSGGSGLGAYTHQPFDLDSVLASSSIAIDGDVYVRFQATPALAAAEVFFDQVRIYRGTLNHAPALTSIATLTGNEDTDLVISYSNLLSAANEADSDFNTIQFLIDSVASGTLKKNGVAVVPGSTLVASGDSLTWSPPLNVNGVTPAFAVRAFDGDLLSVAPVTANISVLAINDAPVLNNSGNPALPTIAEELDSNSNNGILVKDLIAQALPIDMITDVDSGALEGIAIIAVDKTNGGWQYNTNGFWTTITNTAPLATLLYADGFTRVRFVPNINFNGTVGAGLTFRAWDRSNGFTNGSTVVMSSVGGTTAYSEALETASIIVTPVNDAPVLSIPPFAFLPAIDEDDVNNAGALVADFLNSTSPSPVSDVDQGALRGIAVNGIGGQVGVGAWQYSLDNGQNWLNFGSVSNTSARLLAADAQNRIRYVPAKDAFAVPANFIYAAWDQTTGSNGSTANIVFSGGTTAFSSAASQGNITVRPIADTPTVDSQTVVENLISNALMVRRNPNDGVEVTHFVFNNIIGGTLYVAFTNTIIHNGDILSLAQLPQGVMFLASSNYVPVASFQVAASMDGLTISPQSGWATSTLPVRPVGGAPQVAPVATIEDTRTGLITIDRHPTDGPEVTHFTLSAFLGGELYRSDGVTRITLGTKLTYEEAQTGVYFMPFSNYTGPAEFRVTPFGVDLYDAATTVVSVAITPVNDPPAFVLLSSATVIENSAGAEIGDILIVDPDGELPTLAYSDPRFEIAGGKLRLKSGARLDFEAEPAVELTITATDPAGLSASKTYTITTIDVNEPPAFLWLAGSSLVSNRPAGFESAIGILAFDFDQGDAVALAVSDDRFEIVDGLLRVVPARRYEFDEFSLVSLAITATDSQGLSLSDVFTIDVTIENEAPAALSLQKNSLAENSPGAIVGKVSVFDPNAADSHTLAVSDWRFELQGDLLRLKAGQTVDFETSAAIDVEVSATDSHGARLTQTLTIGVEDLPEAPTTLEASRRSVFRNLPGAWVAQLRIADPDRASEYKLSVDDPRFEVRGRQLYLRPGEIIDERAGERIAVMVSVTDAAANAVLAESFQLEVVEPPSDWQAARQWRPDPFDVDADGQIAPLDALLVINALNAGVNSPAGNSAGGTLAPNYYDVSGDDRLSPLDALLVINRLNADFKMAADSAHAQAADALFAAEAPAGDQTRALALAWLYLQGEDDDRE